MNMNKKISSTLLAAALVVSLLAGCVPSTAPASSEAADPGSTAPESTDTAAESSEAAGDTGDAITLRIWDWDEAHLTHMTAFYQQTHPNIQFETLLVQTTDYMQKFQSSLASGTDVPDIVLGELAYRGRLFELGILEDLSQEPYNVKKEDMFDFAVQLQTGPNGELLGVEQQICPSGFAFRRDLAKEYLGTDDPAELFELISTWDAFEEQGKAVVEKSGGAVTIFPGISVMVGVLKGQEPSTYIDGDTINITERYKPVLERAVRMNQSGILGKQENNTPALNSGFAAGEFIFYPCPPWAMKWSVQVNDPEGTGRWGLVKAPDGGFTNGGTSVSIYSDSPHKAEAWEYIQYTYCDGDGVREAFEQFGFMTGFKAPYEDESSYFFTTKGAYDDYFGGQNMADYYINEISLETQGQVQTKNEVTVLEALNAVVAQMANDTSMTADRALELLGQEITTMLPDATIN